MPSNPRLLGILGERARLELRYFELVTLVEMADGSAPNVAGKKEAPITTKKRFMCVGLHCLAFLRESLRRERQSGYIEYAWIDKVVEDKGSTTDFMLIVSGAPADVGQFILIRSESRATAIAQISICYLADAMFRTGKTPPFPKTEEDLHCEVDSFKVLPFKNYKQVVFQDYFLWIREEFMELPSSNSGSSTGIYHVPAAVLMGQNAADTRLGEGEGMTIEVSLHIYPQVQLLNLAQIGREHIRWLALEYKQALIKNQQTYVLRNKLYLKKMNLSNDVSAWICWELALRNKDQLIVVMLLRRQYVPPLMDAVQDFAIILKCPASAISETNTREFQEDFILEAERMADSLNPRAQNQSIYAHMVQGKLDALLYDEEAYSWIRSRLKLKPDGETRLEKYASIFVKGLLKILRDQNALQHPELWDEVSRRVAAVCERKVEQDLDPMVVATQTLRMPNEGLKLDNPDENTDMALSYWHLRVAVYLAWCTDGGLLGSKLTLADVISNLAQDQVHHVARKKLEEILTFLLHLRPKDLKKKWEAKTLPNQMMAMGMLGSDEPPESCIFNDRVMQVLLEMGFLKKNVFPAQAHDEGSMSMAYVHLLKNLMMCEAASVNLKASICRQIVAEREAEHGCALCMGLLELMRRGGLFLATYACAALVNLSQAKEEVKNFLVYHGIAAICLQQLQSKDDDLMLYTLMLLVHLTKYANHRQSMNDAKLVPQLFEILVASYNVLQYKRRILTELCSVLGQMCNDEETRKSICQNYPKCIECLIQIFQTAQELPGDRKAGEVLPSTSTKIISKVMFALKQLCANDRKNKEHVGGFVCKPVIKDLINKNNLVHQDWATNALTLLLLLAVSANNCMNMKDSGWDHAYNSLTASPLGKMDVTRDRIQQINTRCDTIAKHFAELNAHPEVEKL
mmetsp:Transcript_69880/g.138288  ORF Transcript_69880/g.138288 Transcript_69880/m.138288 type:complete len:913 (+) Transcript_69880:141-2879(+)